MSTSNSNNAAPVPQKKILNSNFKVMYQTGSILYVYASNYINAKEFSDFMTLNLNGEKNKNMKVVLFLDKTMFDIKNDSLITFMMKNVIPNDKIVVISDIINFSKPFFSIFSKILLLKDTENFNDIKSVLDENEMEYSVVDAVEDASSYFDINSKNKNKNVEAVEKFKIEISDKK